VPVTNTYTALAGAMPSPHTMDFLKWVDKYLYLRKKSCRGKRTTTYYIDPVSGSDSRTKTQAQSQSTPWQTLTNVRKALSGDGTTIGGSAGFSTPVNNVAFLFKRGTVLRDATGLILGSNSSTVNNTNLYFGGYGAGAKPVISAFTILFNTGFTISTPGGATNRRQITLTGDANITNATSATNIGWLRANSSNTSISQYLPFTYCSGTAVSAGQDATAYALIESIPYSFYVDSNGKLNANFGNQNSFAPFTSSTICYEATPPVTTSGSAPSGFSIQKGTNGLWIDGLVVEGYGCQSVSYQNASGIINGAGAEEVAYISNCESYYNGRHAISHESSDTSTTPVGLGGVHIVENCSVGYCSPNLGYSALNSFASAGSQETAFVNCTIRYGALPASSTLTSNGSNYATYATLNGQMDKSPAFYGHTGYTIASGNSVGVGLYLNIGCRITDERDLISQATVAAEGFGVGDDSSGGLGGLAFCVGTKSDPTSYRVFVIDWKSPRYVRTDVPAGNNFQIVAPSRLMFINCHHYFRPGFAPATETQWWGPKTTALWINSIFEVDAPYTTASGYNTVVFFNNTTTPTVNPRFLNCLFTITGGNASGYASLFKGTFVANSYLTNGPYFGNCLFINTDAVLNGYASPGLKFALGADNDGTDIPQNTSAFLRYVGTAGAQNANLSSPKVNGFDQATGFLDLSTSTNEFPLMVGRPDPVGGNKMIAQGTNNSYPVLDASSVLVGTGSPDPFYDKRTTIGMLPAPQYDFARRLRPSVPAMGPFDVANNQTMIVVGGILVS